MVTSDHRLFAADRNREICHGDIACRWLREL